MVQLRTSLRIFISAVFMLTTALSTAQDANQQTQHPNPPSNAEAAASRPSSSLSSNLGVYVFPTKNQTPQQQSTDEAGCFSWAEEQTGINPMENESFTAQQQQQAQAQVQAQTADRKKTYNKAFSARMEGKGYTVK